jgi:hypothetical protein
VYVPGGLSARAARAERVEAVSGSQTTSPAALTEATASGFIGKVTGENSLSAELLQPWRAALVGLLDGL